MNRVSLVKGTEPFLIIAPHGAFCDDANTDVVSYQMAHDLRGYAVINTGWQRIKQADLKNSRANCNNLNHCIMPTLRQEFLEPIVKFKNEICDRHGVCYVYLIHGMAQKANHEAQFVLGYGQGNKPSYSCSLDHKDLFSYLMTSFGYKTYQGKIGGRFSAWNKNNVNQLFRLHQEDTRVQSIQIEIVSNLRWLDVVAKDVGASLAKAAEAASWRVVKVPGDFVTPEY